MAFCTSCGAPLEGGFCTKCGAKAGSSNVSTPETPPPAPPAAAPVSIPATPPVAPKKRGPLFWILGGCLTLIIIGIVIVVALYFVARRAGFDPALMQKNPAAAVAKILATTNPDIEVISVDNDNGIIKVRDKKTGQTLTMNLKDAQKGKFVFQDDKNQKMEIQTQGQGGNASLEVHSSEGTVKMGASSAAQMPSWLPAYPGAVSSGTISFNANSEDGGSCAYKTSDAPEKVAAFYESALKNAGLKVQKNSAQIPGLGPVTTLNAVDDSTQRSAEVVITKVAEGATISLVFKSK